MELDLIFRCVCTYSPDYVQAPLGSAAAYDTHASSPRSNVAQQRPMHTCSGHLTQTCALTAMREITRVQRMDHHEAELCAACRELCITDEHYDPTVLAYQGVGGADDVQPQLAGGGQLAPVRVGTGARPPCASLPLARMRLHRCVQPCTLPQRSPCTWARLPTRPFSVPVYSIYLTNSDVRPSRVVKQPACGHQLR